MSSTFIREPQFLAQLSRGIQADMALAAEPLIADALRRIEAELRGALGRYLATQVEGMTRMDTRENEIVITIRRDCLLQERGE